MAAKKRTADHKRPRRELTSSRQRRATVYHVTTRLASRSIQKHGFQDSPGRYLTKHIYSGVWVSDRPLLWDVDVDALACFQLKIDTKHLRGFEWVEEGKGYREWLVPAKILNNSSERRLLSFEETFSVELPLPNRRNRSR